VNRRMGRYRETDALLRHAVPLTIRIFEAQKSPVRFVSGLRDDAIHDPDCQGYSRRNKALRRHNPVDFRPSRGDGPARAPRDLTILLKSAPERV